MGTEKISIQQLVRNLILRLGEDPLREGLIRTPERVERMYKELLSGYAKDPKEILTFFDGEKYDGVIEVRNIHFNSLCEHHLLPFFGTVDILYKPNGNVVGLSKLARLVDIYSKRLQLQERLTRQIADAIMQYIKPKGCRVLVKAEHLCMSMRGVNKLGSITETICTRGDIN